MEECLVHKEALPSSSYEPVGQGPPETQLPVWIDHWEQMGEVVRPEPGSYLSQEVITYGRHGMVQTKLEPTCTPFHLHSSIAENGFNVLYYRGYKI